jgi:hypothetical protein
MPDLD